MLENIAGAHRFGVAAGVHELAAVGRSPALFPLTVEHGDLEPVDPVVLERFHGCTRVPGRAELGGERRATALVLGRHGDRRVPTPHAPPYIRARRRLSRAPGSPGRRTRPSRPG